MDFTFLIVFLIIVISSIFFYRKKLIRNKIVNLFESKFTYNLKLYPSIYQIITLSKGNDLFYKVYTIITLKKDFCLSQIFLSEQKEFAIVKAFLYKKIPNFYINSVSKGNKHFAKKYVQKKENIKKYSCYGTITKEIDNFTRKYEFAHFYSSYWPEDIKLCDFSLSSKSIVYIEFPIYYLENLNFVEDFFLCFTNVGDESVKRFEMETVKIKEDLEKIKEYENKDFVQKICSEINQKSKVDIKIKKNKKKIK